MFTGIIEQVGRVVSINRRAGLLTLVISARFDPLPAPGDSIAVDGVCLTATRVDATGFSADVSGETINRSTLGAMNVGREVNLETAAQLGKHLGGHLVYGHVDAMIRMLKVDFQGENRVVRFDLPREIARFVAIKGSVTINGVSLTTNNVTDSWFDLNIVPFTLAHTNLSKLRPGANVNIEVDIVARYIDRLLSIDKKPSLEDMIKDWK